MGATELFSWAQLVVFPTLGIAAALVWFRQRTRPAAYLAASFLALGAVLVLGRVDVPSVGDLLTVLSVTLLLAFPWLLAAFAWSFSGRLPGWLQAAGLGLLGMLVWLVVLRPLPTGGEEGPPEATFLIALLVGWTALSFAAAGRLWRAGGPQRLVRARMRLMAAGAITLAATLVLAAVADLNDGTDLAGLPAALSLVAAALFVAGFAPPAPLRGWWRRRSSDAWQQMQADLIAAATPADVAAAVVGMAADVLGGAVAVIGPDGNVLAIGGVGSPAPADQTAEAWEAGPHVPVGRSSLAVRPTVYTPVFGDQERQLLEGFALQLQMALERAELFEHRAAALAAAERARGELQTMLVGLSHDLRSPAVAITGYAALLRDVDDVDDRAEMLDALGQSAAYLNALVEAMLELSRVGRTQVKVEPVDLARTVASVSERLAGRYPAMSTVVRTGLPTVLVNPSRAEQVFDNLLLNAARHGQRDDITVEISALAVGSGVRIVVSDDGVGVDPAEHAEVFDLFRLGRRTNKGDGVGLGMVRRIVESYGGAVRLAASERGARFELDLPADVVLDLTGVDSVVAQS